MTRPGPIGDRLQRCILVALACASLACAPAGRFGEQIHIAEESAIIVWDAATKTQHFIRRASFETKAKDFGFLVPTPTVPTLEEAEDEAFELLEQIVLPIYKPAALPGGESVKSAQPQPAVRVIATARIAGFEAAVLEADDAGLLDSWLKDNGYSSSPELLEWYRPYVEKQWKITAFKIASDVPEPRLRTSAVRMSFRAEAPFFPYREPASARTGSGADRLLRVYFLGEHRVDGWIGRGGTWPARVFWAGPIEGAQRLRLLNLIGVQEAAVPGATYMTVFEDRSSPRPAVDELYFAVGSNQSLVRPRAPGEIDLGLALFLGSGLLAGAAVVAGGIYLFYRFILLIEKRFRR